MLKTILLIGGPSKGTRFRPLSLDIPKPLFPVAGFPMIYHHIEAASQVEGMKEIIIIGSYQQSEQIGRFIQETQQQFKVLIRYLQEFTALGTAGGMYHFRDQILSGNPDLLFVLNCDVCGDFPLGQMLDFHRSKGQHPHYTIMGTEATRQQSLNYGCLVEDPATNEVHHYVEKPETFVSATINCGVYLFHPEIFTYIAKAFQSNQEELCFSRDVTNPCSQESIRLEQEIFAQQLAGCGGLYVYHTDRFWSQIKNAGAAVYANRHYLNIYQRKHPDRLAQNGEGKPHISGEVYVHPTATVHPTAKLGPNVTVGKNAQIGEGVRIRESIVLEGAILQSHSCILHSIVGWNSVIGQWTRVEGTPNDPNPNKPFAKINILDMFNTDGRLNPAITVIGSNVQVPSEVIVLNSIVLPHKELSHSCKNQIIL